MGLVLVGTILIIFGLYVLLFNVFLIYKGMNAVERATVIEASNVSEKIVEVSEKKIIPKTSPPVVGEEIGKLIIPKLNASIPIFHGTAEDQLIEGVGHVVGTALPGEENNSVLSGHRDTVFRKLGEVTKGDILTVENLNGIFTYKVRKVRIVEADDQTVIVPKRKPTLTLSTCYPFTYIGSAKQRFVLVADLLKSNMKRM
ncbi:class D sortase [Anaerobacillus alkaliphilus]|uniref:Class D sortase n=2 Tax=Anaerobacillus alkaliphilus TaxID=1548597 RepID=A0A4Q0VUM0_9BACI|nr:class D sortase [Anaerobacillus alkaliphilus]